MERLRSGMTKRNTHNRAHPAREMIPIFRTIPHARFFVASLLLLTSWVPHSRQFLMEEGYRLPHFGQMFTKSNLIPRMAVTGT
jgi:hypothetical protein